MQANRNPKEAVVKVGSGLLSLLLHVWVLFYLVNLNVKNKSEANQVKGRKEKAQVVKEESAKKERAKREAEAAIGVEVALDRAKFTALIQPPEPEIVSSPVVSPTLPMQKTNKIADKNTVAASNIPTPLAGDLDKPNTQQVKAGGIRGYRDQYEVEAALLEKIPSPAAESTSEFKSDNQQPSRSELAQKGAKLDSQSESDKPSSFLKNNQEALKGEQKKEVKDLGRGKVIEVARKKINPLLATQKEKELRQSKNRTVVALYKTNYYRELQAGGAVRRGADAETANRSELAIYKKKAIELINRRFQGACRKYADYLVPGYVVVNFSITPNGKVQNLQFTKKIDRSSDLGAIQEGFTIRAIRLAPIPPMPERLVDQLRGDSTHFTMNFYFH